MIPTPTLCQLALGMAGLSITLQLAAAIARSRTSISIDGPAQRPAPVQSRPSLKLTRAELLEHARDLKIGTAAWRNSARKIHLLEAIRQHNTERRAA